MSNPILPSWREGLTRDAILAFLERVDEIPPDDRVAVFDNDGTMWAEKPNYTQIEFWLLEMQEAVATDPSLADRPEFRGFDSRDVWTSEFGTVTSCRARLSSS